MSQIPSNLGNLSKIFEQLQGSQKISPLQKAAIEVQKGARADVETLFDQQGQGFVENISSSFRDRQTQQIGGFADRGFSSEAQALLGDFGGGREGALALGELQDALLGSEVDLQTGFSNTLADIFTGGTQSQVGLLSQLLQVQSARNPVPKVAPLRIKRGR